MTYIPRQPSEGVNAPKSDRIKEFLALSAGLIAILLGVYLVLGLAASALATRMPIRWEQKIGGAFFSAESTDSSVLSEDARLQEVVDRLSGHVPEPKLKYRVRIVCAPQINAMALPGGHIIVMKGLLEKIRSENELAMVLAHEIGHFVHRDHLRAMGRSLVLLALLGIAGYERDLPSSLATTPSGLLTLRFSREQEIAADRFAAELVNAEYGHVGGVTDFFETMMNERDTTALGEYMSTHPSSKSRVDLLEDFMTSRQWRSLPTKTWEKQAALCE